MKALFERYRSFFNTTGIALLSTLVIFGIMALSNGLFQDWENKTLDYRFKIRGAIPTDPRIVLIDIDDESISSIGRWPWDRSVHATLINVLSESGVAVIGYDILFKEESEGNGDKALAKAIEKAENVVLPVGFELVADPEKAPLLTVKRAIGPFLKLEQVAAEMGHISSNRDPDGTIRRVPLFVHYGDNPFPAFPLAILRHFFQVPHDEVLFDADKQVIVLENQMIPINTQSMMLINYAGPWVETFDHYAFSDLLKAAETEAGREDLKRALRGKICIVSNTATGYDLKPVPFESDYPGGGIHANALNTILTGQTLKMIGTLPVFGIALLLSCVTAGLPRKRQPWMGLVGVGSLMIFYLFSSWMLFSVGLILPVLFPVLSLILSTILVLIYQNRLFQEDVESVSKEKEEISGREGKYLSRIEKLGSSLKQESVQRKRLENEKEALEKDLTDHIPEENETRVLNAESSDYGIVSQNKEMLALFEKAKKFAREEKPVLILGESGTGKELFAKAIHQMSLRSKSAFIPVNIPVLEEARIEDELFGHVKGAFPGAHLDKNGLFHEADRGTIFLDEIGEMQIGLQARLLRVLQEGEVKRMGSSKSGQVNVRVIAATNRPLKAEVEKKTFREDLYYRLNVLVIETIPLRERLEDILLLTQYFLEKNAKEAGRPVKRISGQAMTVLKQHHWPGNVRELENTIDRGIALSRGDRIMVADLDLDSPSSLPLTPQPIDEADPKSVPDKDLSDTDFLALLHKNRFEISRTAEQLRVKRVAAGSRFKGICLKVLEEQSGDFGKAIEILSQNGTHAALVEDKLREYSRNLIESIQAFNSSGEAIAESRKRFKNVKKKYHPSMERLIKRYFDDL